MTAHSPLILLTNDDGIASPGLLAAARAVADLGRLLVIAPREQQTGASRNFLREAGHPEPVEISIDGDVSAWAIDASPAQAVLSAVLTLVPRLPDLAISGINYGENLAGGITISGTIGAAIEAASFGIPTLAVSLETDLEYHRTHSLAVDFAVAGHFVRHFARRCLAAPFPTGVDIFNINVPDNATPATPWRLTRVSRQRYFQSIVEDREGLRRITGYRRDINLEAVELDSDVHAVIIDRVVSVSPLAIDMTARVDLARLDEGEHAWFAGSEEG